MPTWPLSDIEGVDPFEIFHRPHVVDEPEGIDTVLQDQVRIEAHGRVRIERPEHEGGAAVHRCDEVGALGKVCAGAVEESAEGIGILDGNPPLLDFPVAVKIPVGRGQDELAGVDLGDVMEIVEVRDGVGNQRDAGADAPGDRQAIVVGEVIVTVAGFGRVGFDADRAKKMVTLMS